MLVLGIESTCDETGCAIVRDGREILSNVVSSQVDLHNIYGGVVPELACRKHVDVIIPVLERALKQANLNADEIDLIAVASGPGLIGALMIGVTAAKALAKGLNKPFIGVNHVEAHLYASLMSHDHEPEFPALGVIISGGHTSLVEMQGIGSYRLLSNTADDAVGEAFDKAAKILGLPYPGGPEIEKLALRGNEKAYPFKPGRVKDNPLAFSYSGLKTAVLYAFKEEGANAADIAASFQKAALDAIIQNVERAMKTFACRSLIFGGGVTNNEKLKSLCMEAFPNIPLFWPIKALSLDNAAMIAGLGYHKYLQKKSGDPYHLEAASRVTW